MQPGSMQGMVIVVKVAAGRLLIKTVGEPGGISINGNAGCGTADSWETPKAVRRHVHQFHFHGVTRYSPAARLGSRN
jgi:hypothetical protein